jgi:ATP synthase protein I
MLRATSKRAERWRNLPFVYALTGEMGYAQRKWEDATMTDDRDEGLEKRRAELGAELASKRAAVREDESGEVRAEVSRKGYAQAMKLSSEFIAAIIVGAVLGYVFDRFVGTAPWGMIILLLLGFCAGVLNVLRSAGKVATPVLEERGPDKK